MVTTSTEYGRGKIFWPDFAHEGGTTLHSKVVGTFADKYGVETISDYLSHVWYGATTLSNSATQNFVHNYGLAVGELIVGIWESGVLQTSAQIAANYTIAQVSTSTISVTNISGGSKTFDIGIKPYHAGLIVNQNDEISNLGISATVGSNALTIALKVADGSTNPSASNFVKIAFRSSTATSGSYSYAKAVAATSLVVSSGSTLGTQSGMAEYLYVYALNNSGTIELAVSRSTFDDQAIVSTTAEGGAGAADSDTVLYSTTARSNVPIKLIGRILITEATAGTWASSPTSVSVVGPMTGMNPYGTYYKEAVISTTFNTTVGSATASSAVNLVVKRIGSLVYLHIPRPSTGVVISSGSPMFIRASPNLPAWATPSTIIDGVVEITDSADTNSDNDRRNGLLEIDASGHLDLYKDFLAGTTFGSTSTVNIARISFTYHVA